MCNYNPADGGNWKGGYPRQREGWTWLNAFCPMPRSQWIFTHLKILKKLSFPYISCGKNWHRIRMSFCLLASNQHSLQALSPCHVSPTFLPAWHYRWHLIPCQKLITHCERLLTSKHCIYFGPFCRGFWQIFPLKCKGSLWAFLKNKPPSEMLLWQM